MKRTKEVIPTAPVLQSELQVEESESQMSIRTVRANFHYNGAAGAGHKAVSGV